MTPQQMQTKIENLEARVGTLEKEIRRLTPAGMKPNDCVRMTIRESWPICPDLEEPCGPGPPVPLRLDQDDPDAELVPFHFPRHGELIG